MTSNINVNVDYYSNSNLIVRFYEHAKFALKGKVGENYKKNEREKLGDCGLWLIENMPGKIWRLAKEPRWITFVLTTLSTAAVTYAFYPQYSVLLAQRAWKVMPKPTLEQVKFGAYLATVTTIISAGLRAEGRFSNPSLMHAWYSSDKSRRTRY